jgi:uridine kinase
MKNDKILIEEYHRRIAVKIVEALMPEIRQHSRRYVISVGGESGSGKSETAMAIVLVLETKGVKAVVLGQDDYFILPPKSNDARRREDPDWLGPAAEVRLDVLEQNIKDAINGAVMIEKPLVDYDSDCIDREQLDLKGVRVIIVEGTYTTLLKHIDTKIFIARSRLDTLAHRRKRARGKEAVDPFIENVLKTEHKIIAGHKYLADYIISKDYKTLIPAVI